MSTKTVILQALYHSGLTGLVRRLRRSEFLGCRVLNFHRVLPAGAPRDHYAALMGEPTADQLEHLIRYLRRSFRFVTPQECLERWRSGAEVEPYSLMLTFDDGYADLHQNLLPVLEKYRVPAAVFLATGGIEGSPLWFQRLFAAFIHTPLQALIGFRSVPDLPLRSVRERVAAIEAVATRKRAFSAEAWEELVFALEEALHAPDGAPGEEMLTWKQAEALHRSGLVTLGAHTVTHPLLGRCTADRARREIEESARTVRERFGLCFVPFAYPNGDYSPEVEAMVRDAGWDCAFTMDRRINTRATSPFALGRQTLSEPSNLARCAFELSGVRRPRKPARTARSGAVETTPLPELHRAR